MAALPTAANFVAVTLLVLLIWTPDVINAVREYKKQKFILILFILSCKMKNRFFLKVS